MKEPLSLDSPEAPAAPAGDEVYLLPTSFAQRRLWFLYQIGSGTAAYNISGRFRFRGPLERDVLERSLREIVRRHEILRTTFLLQGDDLVQVVATEGRPALDWFDLRLSPPRRVNRRRRRCSKASPCAPSTWSADRCCAVS